MPAAPQATERPAPVGPSPGGFTQVISGRSQGRLGDPAGDAAVGQAPAETPAPGMPRWLVISLVVLAVLAVALVVVIAVV
jgi:hypothetical protein